MSLLTPYNSSKEIHPANLNSFFYELVFSPSGQISEIDLKKSDCNHVFFFITKNLLGKISCLAVQEKAIIFLYYKFEFYIEIATKLI